MFLINYYYPLGMLGVCQCNGMQSIAKETEERCILASKRVAGLKAGAFTPAIHTFTDFGCIF